MTYMPGIPLSTDEISTSQGQLKDNFDQLNSQFGIDHSAFNTGSGNGTGFHKKVTLPGNVSTPSISTGNGAIFGKTTSSGTYPYWIRDNVTLQYPLGSVQAFCKFTTNGGPSLFSNSFNVSSVTLVSTGKYQINFTQSLPDANYVVIPSFLYPSLPPAGAAIIAVGPSLLPGSVQIQLMKQDGSGFSTDLPQIFVTVFRNG